MTRKTFTYPLLDNNTYEFAERNREDLEFAHLQNEVRKGKMIFAKEVIRPMSEDLFDAAIMSHLNAVYSAQEIWLYIESNAEEIFKLVYASFKIKNEKISFEDFKKLVNVGLCKSLLNKLNEIEKPEESSDLDVAEVLGLPIKNKVSPLMAKWAKDHPEVYGWLKQNVKKKEQESAQK